MNWLDIIIIVIIAIPTVVGLKMGIIKALLSLAGVILGVILAGRFYSQLAGELTFITEENLAKIVAFAIIFLGIMIIAGVAAGILSKIVSMMLLGWVNHLGGAAFGFLLGGIFCGALLAIWAKFLGTGAIIDSSLAPILLDKFPSVLSLLPGEFDAVRDFF
ncbi:MAG: CvpA family protein [Chloroflexota bacterium]